MTPAENFLIISLESSSNEVKDAARKMLGAAKTTQQNLADKELAEMVRQLSMAKLFKKTKKHGII